MIVAPGSQFRGSPRSVGAEDNIINIMMIIGDDGENEECADQS